MILFETFALVLYDMLRYITSRLSLGSLLVPSVMSQLRNKLRLLQTCMRALGSSVLGCLRSHVQLSIFHECEANQTYN